MHRRVFPFFQFLKMFPVHDMEFISLPSTPQKKNPKDATGLHTLPVCKSGNPEGCPLLQSLPLTTEQVNFRSNGSSWSRDCDRAEDGLLYRAQRAFAEVSVAWLCSIYNTFLFTIHSFPSDSQSIFHSHLESATALWIVCICTTC